MIGAMHDVEWLAEEKGQAMPWWVDNNALFFFGPRNRFRLVVWRATAHRFYQVSEACRLEKSAEPPACVMRHPGECC